LLTRIADQRKAARLVVRRIKGLRRKSERQSALDRLVILAGLRKMLGTMVCHFECNVAASKSIKWPAVGENKFRSNSRVFGTRRMDKAYSGREFKMKA